MATRDELANVGARTIKDVVQKALQDAGLSEAAGFELKLTNGETITISSESNPNLSRPAAEVEEVKVRQSARAGAVKFETVISIHLGE